MKGKNITVVGMVLEDIFADFSKELISNVMEAIPENKDIRLVVLPGRYYNPELPYDDICAYNEVYNTILKLGEVCNFDGFIVHIGNLSSNKRNTIDESLIADFKKVPNVFIATDIENVTTVSYDNESGIREAIDYLVNIDGLSRLCMLGGRVDNLDSILRKEIFIRCLEENGIAFSEDNFINTDMSENCVEEAGKLLDRNPDAQAIFCVTDATAKGLYVAMEERGLVPGRNILVFGFDNTRMASEMIPSLSSIGCDSCTLGQKALELLIDKFNGIENGSALVQTRLYGRESLFYEMYDYSATEMTKGDPAFIYRMFDDCLYRYKNEYMRWENVNLIRLFYEFISRILLSQKRKYMSLESYHEICILIDIFFEKGAMNYTDAAKLIKSIERLQSTMNSGKVSVAANVMVNRLFSRMKDKAIISISERSIKQISYLNDMREKFHDFLIADMVDGGTINLKNDSIAHSISKLGLKNSVIYAFDEAVEYTRSGEVVFPKHIRLYCVIKSGDMYILAKERQDCLLSDIFTRNELSSKCKGFAAFPIFYSDRIYGILLSELTEDIFSRGEFLALQIGRSFYINDLRISEKEGIHEMYSNKAVSG